MDQMVVLQARDVPIVVGRIRFSITSRDLLTLVIVVGCCSRPANSGRYLKPHYVCSDYQKRKRKDKVETLSAGVVCFYQHQTTQSISITIISCKSV